MPFNPLKNLSNVNLKLLLLFQVYMFMYDNCENLPSYFQKKHVDTNNSYLNTCI